MPARFARLGPTSIKNWATKNLGEVLFNSGWWFLLGTHPKFCSWCSGCPCARKRAGCAYPCAARCFGKWVSSCKSSIQNLYKVRFVALQFEPSPMRSCEVVFRFCLKQVYVLPLCKVLGASLPNCLRVQWPWRGRGIWCLTQIFLSPTSLSSNCLESLVMGIDQTNSKSSCLVFSIAGLQRSYSENSIHFASCCGLWAGTVRVQITQA